MKSGGIPPQAAENMENLAFLLMCRYYQQPHTIKSPCEKSEGIAELYIFY